MTDDQKTIKQWRALIAELQHILVQLLGIYKEINTSHTTPSVRESGLLIAESLIHTMQMKMEAGDALLNDLSVQPDPIPEHLIKPSLRVA